MTREQLIHNAAMEILGEVGVKIYNTKALEIYKSNGIRVENDTVYLTEEQVMHWLKKAPAEFTIHARNPKYDMIIGGDRVNHAPTYGCAFIDDWDGNRRRGTADQKRRIPLHRHHLCFRFGLYRDARHLFCHPR